MSTRHDDRVIDLRSIRPLEPATPRPALSMVYGGGGAVGIAWHVAVIEALRNAGLPVTTAPSLGTSAGSWACGAARLGFGFDQFESFEDLNLPDRTPGLLAGMARQIFGNERVEDGSVSVVSLPTMRRKMLDGRTTDLADLVAASSAVPGLFAPHMINGTNFVDGGVRSMASAEAAVGADLLIASLPIAGSLFGPVGRAFERTSRRALARWRVHHGGMTMVFRPGKAFVSAVGRSPSAIMNVECAKAVYPIAYDTVSRRLERRLTEIELRRTEAKVS